MWNTLLISDESQLMGAFNAVSGMVTAADGALVSEAVVTMQVGGIAHETITGKDGRYTFLLADTVKPGPYRVICAGQTQTVTVSLARQPPRTTTG